MKIKMDDDSHDHDEAEEDVTLQPPLEKPRIYEGASLKNIPQGFDAVTIYLDGRIEADLNWKKGREEAQFAVDQGYAILWDIQLGFGNLTQPLSNQAQYLALALSLEHFRDTLWMEFRPSSLGLSLFRGAADFSHSLPWNFDQDQNFTAWFQENCNPDGKEPVPLRHELKGQQLISLFCRDAAVEYLSLLANRLPDTLPVYLFLDAAYFEGSLTNEIQYLNPERFERFHLALKNTHLPFGTLGWGRPTPLGVSALSFAELPEKKPVSIGVCIPPASVASLDAYQGLEDILRALQKKSIPFKLVAESKLTAQWDGLDYLIYCPAGLSKEGKRKLQGFCAAGGTVVSTGERQGLPLEADLDTLFKG